MKKIINRGFTLIELLVVIAIIGILASIILVSLGSARSKGSDTRIISDINQIRTQIESEATGAGYTAGAAKCVATATTFGTGNCTSLSTDVTTTGGVASVQTDTITGGIFSVYRVSGSLKTSGQYYCADSTGKTLQTSTAPAGTSC